MISIAWALPGGAANNPPFANQTVAVGDQAVFSFKGLHGLFKIPDANCPGERSQIRSSRGGRKCSAGLCH